MGRHADPTATRRQFPTLLIAAGAVIVLLAGGLVWWLAAGSDGEDCATRSTVAVTVAPEMADLAEGLLSDPDALGADGCVTAEGTAQQPLQTAGDLSALSGDAVPDVWVPDSSLWYPRAGDAELSPGPSMANSPVVLSTSAAVADAEGWTDSPPTWAGALTGDQPVAMPDIAASAEALADHQPFSPRLLTRLEGEARMLGAQLVTTEKDAARLPDDFRGKVLTLPARLRFDDPAELDRRLDALFD